MSIEVQQEMRSRGEISIQEYESWCQGIAEPTDESLSERGDGSGEQERWERAP